MAFAFVHARVIACTFWLALAGEASNEESLSLLQLAATKGKATSLINSTGGYPRGDYPPCQEKACKNSCWVESADWQEVHKTGEWAQDHVITQSSGKLTRFSKSPGLHTVTASKDGNIVVQLMSCWQDAMMWGRNTRTRGVAVKIHDVHLMFTPDDWEEASKAPYAGTADATDWGNWADRNKKYTKNGKVTYNAALTIGKGSQPKNIYDLETKHCSECTQVGGPDKQWYNILDANLGDDVVVIRDLQERIIENGNGYYFAGPIFWVYHKPTGFGINIKFMIRGDRSAFNIQDIVWNDGEGDPDDETDTSKYTLCNTHYLMNRRAREMTTISGNLPSDYREKQIYLKRAAKHVPLRSGSKAGWQWVDDPKTPNYEANLFDVISYGTNGKYCHYCDWDMTDTIGEQRMAYHTDESPFWELKNLQKCEAWTFGSVWNEELAVPSADHCSNATKDDVDSAKGDLQKLKDEYKLKMKAAQQHADDLTDRMGRCELR